MNYYDIYRKLQKGNITNTNLGHVFINDYGESGSKECTKKFSDEKDVSKHFEHFSNWYLPFDRCSCLNVVAKEGKGNVLESNCVTFVDNPEHLLTSRLHFTFISPLYGELSGQVWLSRTKDVPKNNEEAFDKTPLGNFTYVSGFSDLDPNDFSDENAYRIVTSFKRFSIKGDRNKVITYDPIYKLVIEASKEGGSIKEAFYETLRTVKECVTHSFMYFTKIMIDSSLFIVEERIASKKKGRVKVRPGTPALYHAIDLRTIRSRYIKRNPNDTPIVREGGWRRQHTRTFKSDFYKNMKGETIIIKATWIGPSESFDPGTDRLYKVRLDVG